MAKKKWLIYAVNPVFFLGIASCLFSNDSGSKNFNSKVKKPPTINDDMFENLPSFQDSYAVTYDFSGGRFGDNLLSYLHAKWISYKYNMLFLYRPFPYSDELALSELETKINDYCCGHEINIFKRKMVCDSNLRYFRPSDLLIKNPPGSILYVVPYFPESGCKRTWFFNGSKKWLYFDVDWKDQGFRSIVLKMLRPIKFFKLCDCPLDKITVAIHIRTGKGFDCQNICQNEPHLAPPLKFYHEALRSLINIYPDRELYFHIFTDDPEPDVIANSIENYIKNIATAPFSVHYRTSKNRQNLNVIEDFFSLFQFDCLIRPDSNFSRVPSLLKEYKVLIYPSDLEKLGDRNYIISKIDVVRNE